MSLKKQLIRLRFREAVFERDNFRCRKCNRGNGCALDAHHIINRNEMKDGGYILSNGISLCDECHFKAEQRVLGYHPDDLKKLIL